MHEPHAVPYVSGCAMYIKQEVIKEVGVFDEGFHPCYFEDSDLCYRVWASNRTVVVAPGVNILHHGGASAGQSIESGYKSYQKKHAELFLMKHRAHLTAVKNKVKSINKSIDLV